MNHGIEAICSNRANDAVCQQGLRHLHDDLLRTKSNPDDEEGAALHAANPQPIWEPGDVVRILKMAA